MRRHAGIVLLCAAIALPSVLFGRAPAPRPRATSEAARILAQFYPYAKDPIAKAPIQFLLRGPARDSTNRYLFAVAAGKMTLAADGWVMFDQAWIAGYFRDGGQLSDDGSHRPFKLQFHPPARGVRDLGKVKLRALGLGGSTLTFDEEP